jgi:GT2 family glycosyltransferase
MHDRQAVQVERVLGIDERSFWVRGWASDRATGYPNVVLVSPEGHRVPVTEGAHRLARPDVDQFFAGAQSITPGIESGTKHGFVKYVEIPSPSVLASGWVAELRDPDVLGVEIEAPPVEKDVASVRRGIMTDLEHFASLTPDDEFLLRHAHPALSKLQERIRQAVSVDAVKQFGEPSESPDVSVIVPLYGRIDFIEHQLCQFMHDPDFRELDLIYVLDSPELGEQLGKSAAALHALYELPFRTVTLNRNAGYSMANNLGASLARGRLLLLLNSDVVPDFPGWIRELTRFYDATPAIGALGPKLLYEDGSLQHAGLYFDREPGTSLWTNLHYFKGLQSDFPPANIARPVPAVTGACLMIARSIWEDLGGLRPDFVQGGYEDSDLCLRLLEAGRDNWYLPHVELHHLEDQSFPSAARRMATAYNTWLQTFVRGEQIERLMGEEPFSAQPGRYLLNSI